MEHPPKNHFPLTKKKTDNYPPAKVKNFSGEKKNCLPLARAFSNNGRHARVPVNEITRDRASERGRIPLNYCSKKSMSPKFFRAQKLFQESREQASQRVKSKNCRKLFLPAIPETTIQRRLPLVNTRGAAETNAPLQKCSG